MYETFYGFREKPFSLTPDTDFFYRYRSHQEALNVLMVALRNGEGFVRVTGEVGTGKTLLCRQFLNLIQDDCATAYLPNPLLSPRELYQAIAHDLDLDVPADASIHLLLQKIFEELVRLRKLKRPLVVLIDEAQVMSRGSLEALRLLSNLETEKEKLLHIFFFAQPEFEQRLQDDNLRQLLQRITFSHVLTPLDHRELAVYLDHRIRIAGWQGTTLFTAGAVRLLHKASGGIPRLVNLLAHKALLDAYGKGKRQIERKAVQVAIKDTPGLKQSQKKWLPQYFFEFGMVVAVAVVALCVFGGWQ